MAGLEWVRNPLLDSDKAVTDFGTYICIRTYNDVSVLWFDGEELSRNSAGSHSKSKSVAQDHYDELLAGQTEENSHTDNRIDKAIKILQAVHDGFTTPLVPEIKDYQKEITDTIQGLRTYDSESREHRNLSDEF